MDVTQATLNALYAVDSDNMVVSLLLASLVPFVARRMYHFFQVTWPRMLHSVLLRSILYREVAVVEQDGDNGEHEMNRLVDNEVLIEMMLEYVGHLARQARVHQERKERRARAAGKRVGVAASNAELDDDDDHEVWVPSMETLADLPYAAFRYAAIPTGHAGNKSAASAKKAPLNEASTSGHGSGETTVLARYLKENFQLTLAPTNEVAIEVEPGLFIRYVSATQTLQELKDQRQANASVMRETGDSGRAALAARGVLEDYLLYDLINKLQENGNKPKRRRRGEFHDDDSEQGNDTFLQPFRDGAESTDEDSENRDSDDSERASSDDNEAARQGERAPRQILLQCRALRTVAQQEAYLRWLRRSEKAKPGGPRAAARPTDDHLPTLEEMSCEADDSLSRGERARLLLPKTRIENFAARAREWYTAQINKPTSASLFLFYPTASEASTALKQQKAKAGGNDNDNDSDDWSDMDSDGGKGNMSAYLQVRRYPIPVADEGEGGIGAPNMGGKTFRSLFFAQKPRVMQLLEDFQNRTGKYAIPGVPHRMTWLVHGPPGTGKTSLVKAMARHLHRHVVVLQIGSIRTATLFSAWMNEAEVNCSGEENVDWEVYTDDSYVDCFTSDKTVRLRPSEVIYLLEDVDAIDKVDGLVKDTPSASVQNDNKTDDEQSSNDDDSSDSDDDSSDSDGSSDDDSKPSSDDGTDEEEESGTDSGSTDAEETESAKLRKAAKKQLRMEALMQEVMKELNKDQLTVEAMINTFNGVAVPSGRIVVMTTNHPERLDPRLLHPSVLSMKVNMDDFDAEQATHMVRHYFPEYTARAMMPPGSSPAAIHAEEQRLTHALRTRMAAILARRNTAVGDDSSRGGASSGDARTPREDQVGGKVNPARLEQACAECSSVEELLKTLETGRYELRDNIY